MMENNLRIFFDDTSSLAGYPTNNWRIVANDSASGGASHFSIDDVDEGSTPFRIEAGAPNYSLYVEDMGRIGIKTSTPAVEIHVKDGDSPTLRLEQDGSYGFTPQTWDICGNETNFFVRDATGGSRLPLRIRPGAPTSSIDIATSGNVGIGTGSPAASLHISRSDATAKLEVEETNSTAATRTLAYLVNNGGVRFDLEDTATGVTWVFQNQTSNFEITKAGTGIRELSLDGSGNLTITGTMTVRSGHANQTTYPDFVFEPEYPLMPLNQLQEYITENKHLPEIPDAETLTENGLNMTEMQLKLLQKVEELTLYTLDQERTIRAQQTEIEQLRTDKEEIEQLKARLSALEQR
jgi:hypothetical protein